MERINNLEKSYLALFEFLLMSKSKLAHMAEEYKLSIVQAITLVLLSETKPMHSFTKIFHCDASNTTGIIDGLVKKGLVDRSESPNDRRVKMVHINPEGEKLRKIIIGRLTGQDSFIVQKLSDKELTDFINLLQKITN